MIWGKREFVIFWRTACEWNKYTTLSINESRRMSLLFDCCLHNQPKSHLQLYNESIVRKMLHLLRKHILCDF